MQIYITFFAVVVAIPLEQGRFFNQVYASRSARNASRNPFGAGTVFQSKIYAIFTPLKSRNPFGAGTVFQLMELIEERQQIVAIPLEQGRFFN